MLSPEELWWKFKNKTHNNIQKCYDILGPQAGRWIWEILRGFLWFFGKISCSREEPNRTGKASLSLQIDRRSFVWKFFSFVFQFTHSESIWNTKETNKYLEASAPATIIAIKNTIMLPPLYLSCPPCVDFTILNFNWIMLTFTIIYEFLNKSLILPIL